MTAVIAPPPASAPAAVTRPPRYSLLEGALPPLQSASTSTLSTRSHSPSPSLPIAARTEPEPHTRRPPRYSSVFNRTRIEQRERRQRARNPHGPSSSSAASNRYSTHPGASSSTSNRSRSGPQLHEYHLRSGGGRTAPFATLRVYSRTSAAGASSVRIPKFVGADLVQGSLDLNLETPTSINSISLTLRGRIITSAYDGGSHTFLEHPIISWTRAHGDPRSMLLTPLDPHDTARPKKFEGKLSGTYSWPFSFAFPQTTDRDHPTSDASGSTATPQTFTEKDVKASVQYELVLRMTHGLLRSDSKLHAHVVYVPAIAPPSESNALRDIAYGAGMGMPSPDVDPSGWMVVGKRMVQGRIFRERGVKLECTLSLANPQSYTRGTVIPCHLAIEGTDTQALDVCATPQAIRLRLVRRLRYHDHSASTSGNGTSNSGSTRATIDSEHVEEIESAVWWVNMNSNDNAREAERSGRRSSVARRALEGEIHLEKELQPSCGFALFQVEYTVELLPFATPVFQLKNINTSNTSPSSPKSSSSQATSHTPIIAHPVTIATLPGEGPTPVAHTAPKPRVKRRIQVHTRSASGYEYEYAPGASVRVIAGVGVYI